MAIERNQIYKCPHCGNMVEVVHAGGGTLVCCGDPMLLLTENTTDAAVEKHVPVVEKVDGGIKVTVGSVEHPMVDDHWIEWIEVSVDGKAYTQFLDPADPPSAFFAIDGEGVTARAYCNLHGLWKA
jgi:superoxide reductase